MMQVYRIRPSYQTYQTIDLIEGDRHFKTPPDRQHPLIDQWKNCIGYVDDPTLPRGDFLYYSLEFIVTSAEHTSTLHQCIADDVQQLPLRLQGATGEYLLWNITRYVEAVDLQASTFLLSKYQRAPTRWVFDEHRLPEPMLFRDASAPVTPLVATGFGDPARDFYVQYHAHGMSGLRFELLWSRNEG